MTRPDSYRFPMFGAISDFIIWNKTFSAVEVNDFFRCKDIGGKSLFLLDSIKDLSGFSIQKENGNFCRKAMDSFIIGNSKIELDLKGMVNFCQNAYNSKIAVAYNKNEKERMVMESELSGINIIFSGYTIGENGTFVDLYHKTPHSFKWDPGQPNSIGGEQECAAWKLGKDLG